MVHSLINSIWLTVPGSMWRLTLQISIDSHASRVPRVEMYHVSYHTEIPLNAPQACSILRIHVSHATLSRMVLVLTTKALNLNFAGFGQSLLLAWDNTLFSNQNIGWEFSHHTVLFQFRFLFTGSKLTILMFPFDMN